MVFGAAVKSSCAVAAKGESRIWGSRPAPIFVAVIGLMATATLIVVAFVRPLKEEQLAMAVFKVVCMAGILPLVGASLYGIGDLCARRQSITVRSNAVG
jgi:hypothetical protein